MEEPSDDRDRSRSRSPQTQRGLEQESGTPSRFYLGNLGSRVISEKDLTEFFGKMVSAEITDVVVKHHKGFGYIEFERTSQYEESKLLGKHVINGRNVECKRAKPREQIQTPTPDVKPQEAQGSNDHHSGSAGQEKFGNKRFFIGGINSTFTQNDIVEYFRGFGVIVDVLLLFHKGFGYIEFSRMNNYDESRIIGSHQIRGRSLEVKKAKPKGPPSGSHPIQHVQSAPPPSMPLHVQPPPPPVHQAVFNSQHHHGRDHPGMHNVQDSTSPRYFLGGVNEDISHQDLKDYFKQFGTLIDVTIIPNKSIGYIQFKKCSEVVEAEREDKLFHQKHHIKSRLVNCSRANPKQNYAQDFNFPKHHMPFNRPNFPHLEQENMDHMQEGVVSPRRFFLGGVNATTTRANLMEYFTKYGEIINLMIFEAKNYGYIEFKRTTQEDDVQRESILIGDAGRSLHTISGCTITCKRAIPRTMKQHQMHPPMHPTMQPPMQPPMHPPMQPPMHPPMHPPMQHLPPQVEPQDDKADDSKFKMFVGGLGLLTEEQVKEYFSKIGDVDNILLLRGFGFITFKLAGMVDKVIQEGKVINGKTMHCINGKYVECKRTHGKTNKKPRPAGGMYPGQTPQYPGQMPPSQGWNNFNPEAPPFTPNSMQQNPSQPQQQPQQQQQQQQQQQFPPGGYYPQGQGGAFPGQMTPQGYTWNNYGMMPQQGYDMNNPGVMTQQGYDMNNTAMMGQQGYDMNNPAMMGQQGYDWNNTGMAPQQYVDWNTYMAQQNFDWNSGVTYTPYYAGQTIQFPDFVTGESSSSMNASEQGSTSADNDNSSASTPTQDSQQTASSNMEERTEEIPDNTSSMSIQSVLSKYATSDNPQQTKTVQSVLSKYSVVPTIQTDYSSGEQQSSSEDQESAHSSGNGRRLYENRSVQQNVNGGEEEEEEEEEEEWFEGDLELE